MAKIIKLDENRFNRLFLIENRESKNINLARKFLKTKGFSQERANKIVDDIRTNIPNSRIAECKFLLGVSRLFLDGELDNYSNISRLNETLKYIGSNAHVNEYNNDLNGENLETLIKRFDKNIEHDLENDKEKLKKLNLSNNNGNYDIKLIPSFNDAEKYKDYTSWCVTHDPEMYNTYTSNGVKPFYFCLKHGFEDVKKEIGENCPLDEYGLSMIAISVNENGSLNTCTCRWNHDNKGNDNIMTTEEISNLFGESFYELFKPYSEEYIKQKKEEFYQKYETALRNIKHNHVALEDAFSDYDKLSNSVYFVWINDSSEIGAVIFYNEEENEDFIRDENNRIIFYKRFYPITNKIFAYVEENDKSGLLEMPNMTIISEFPDNTEAYLLLIDRNSTFYGMIYYLDYLNGKIQFIDIYRNLKSQLIDFPTHYELTNNEDILAIFYKNKQTLYFDLRNFKFIDKVENLFNIVDSFSFENYNFDIIKVNDKFNILNKENYIKILPTDAKNITINKKANILIVTYQNNVIKFYRIDSFNGEKFKPLFFFNIIDYKQDKNNEYIYHLKIDNGAIFKYNFLTKEMNVEENKQNIFINKKTIYIKENKFNKLFDII